MELLTWRDMEIAPPSDTCPLWITKETIYSRPGVLVCPRTSAFHWFNHYAYSKTGRFGVISIIEQVFISLY